ncbi:MAG: MotA/TolQ/ExbB proton channel family protein [Opitutales bacterium]
MMLKTKTVRPSGRLRAVLLLAITVCAVSAYGQDAAATASEQQTSLLGLLQQGGWAMYPLGITALFMFFLIFYCWRETGAARFIPDAAMEPLDNALAQRAIDQARSIAAGAASVLTRCLGSALKKSRPERPDGNKDKIEASFMDAVEAEDGAISQWINYLNVVAAVAPMIGLLGTVSGMISAFQTIGQVGMGDPSALAGDIGEALITTATGLTIGIPAMIAYFIFRNRLNAQILRTVETGGDLIDSYVEAGSTEPKEAS